MATKPHSLLLAAALMAASVLATTAAAQSGAPAADNPAGSEGNGLPIAIDAESGIEWLPQDQVVTARGNVRAVRGEMDVRADVLRAFYRELPGGGTDIWRIDAEGNVIITTPGEQAFADTGTYDFDDGLLTLQAREQVRLVSGDNEVTARKEMQYWTEKKVLVARGDAVAQTPERQIFAEVLTAQLGAAEPGQSRLKRLQAQDRVKVISATEQVRADRGVYDAETGIATFAGSVKITRGSSQLNGCKGEINLNTGASKLQACAPGPSGGSRVYGLIEPKTLGKDRSAE
jgi:lipopolysaccharide export system protein LptA